jgi:hypothetical protein
MRGDVAIPRIRLVRDVSAVLIKPVDASELTRLQGIHDSLAAPCIPLDAGAPSFRVAQSAIRARASEKTVSRPRCCKFGASEIEKCL